MKLETKYSIGDIVWFLAGYDVCRANIMGVKYEKIGDAAPYIAYKFAVFPIRKESECFSSKEDLINYLNK